MSGGAAQCFEYILPGNDSHQAPFFDDRETLGPHLHQLLKQPTQRHVGSHRFRINGHHGFGRTAYDLVIMGYDGLGRKDKGLKQVKFGDYAHQAFVFIEYRDAVKVVGFKDLF